DRQVDRSCDEAQQKRNGDRQVDRSCDEAQHKRNDDEQVDHSCVVEPPQSHIMDVSNDHNMIVPFTWEQLKQLQHQ
ncbi:unnamed protein product, partial [Rotaria socialis]